MMGEVVGVYGQTPHSGCGSGNGMTATVIDRWII
jgi:hypothetical protein